MDDVLDEDAPTLARTAATVVDVLSDATAASVGYPGLEGARDTEAVLAALSTLAEGLQETVVHLTRYLDEQLRAEQLTPAAGSSRNPSATAGVATDALRQVRDAAADMSALLTRAELALLELDTRRPA